MKPLLETPLLIVSHDPFKANLIADCEFAIARLPWDARGKLDRIKSDSKESFRLSVPALGGVITQEKAIEAWVKGNFAK